MNLIDSKITTFYTQSAEESRLKMGLGPLEFERNKDLITRHLPKPSCTITDVGGGPGHYAAWLSNLGHHVTLIDPVQKHIEQAEKRSKRSKATFQCIRGEARKLPIEDQSVDVVMLHGPLYHLQERSERIAALKEARRVLKTGGIVLGFAITHSAFTLAALQNGLIHNDDVFSMCKEELTSGSHNPPEGFPGILAKAYFHRPDTLVGEFESAGFKTISLLAVEGIAWMDQKYFESWSTPDKKQRLMDLLRITESDPGLLALSPHIMLAAEIHHLTE